MFKNSLRLIVLLVILNYTSGYSFSSIENEVEYQPDLSKAKTVALINQYERPLGHQEKRKRSFFSTLAGLFNPEPENNVYMVFKKDGHVFYVPFMLNVKPTF